MYENRSEPLVSEWEFFFRVIRQGLFALGVVIVALLIGILGYHGFKSMPWLDATLNASMMHIVCYTGFFESDVDDSENQK